MIIPKDVIMALLLFLRVIPIICIFLLSQVSCQGKDYIIFGDYNVMIRVESVSYR